MMEPDPVPVVFAQHELDYAHEIAVGRNTTGGKSNPLDSGHNAVKGDYVGALAEMAVCIAYGEDYREYVTVYRRRPGAIADLKHKGLSVSVKGRTRFDSPDLIVPDYDVNNDIYVLVSVNTYRGYAELRGWITREKLLEYQPEEWKWTDDRPGKKKKKMRRYVPIGELRQCRTAVSAEELIVR